MRERDGVNEGERLGRRGWRQNRSLGPKGRLGCDRAQATAHRPGGSWR